MVGGAILDLKLSLVLVSALRVLVNASIMPVCCCLDVD
jgi:hypothetical protein